MRTLRNHMIRSTLMTLAALAVVAGGLHVTVSVSPAAAAPVGQQDASAAAARIASMSARLTSTMRSYAAASDELAKTRKAIAGSSVRAKELDRSIAAGRTRLAAEARFLYLTGNLGFAEILLGSATFEEFVNRSLALKRVTARDAQLVEILAAEQAERSALRAELLRRERQQEQLVRKLAGDRSAAQRALDAQQRYVDSLAPAVAATLDSQRTSRNTRGSSRPRSAPAGSVVSATLVGRGGRYAVLSGQPMRYQPTGVTFDGIATWYGNVRPNMGTASGRPFDENELTCAHKSLPFGTRVAVTFRGKSVIVTVTDRGPYGRGRVIDLSKRAASLIGLKSAGVGQVHCEVVRPAR